MSNNLIERLNFKRKVGIEVSAEPVYTFSLAELNEIIQAISSPASKVVIDEIFQAITPFVKAKKYNPNKSTSINSTRVMHVKASEIANIYALYTKLGGKL